MKFGKQFEHYKIPEWSDNYFDYNELKILLKQLKKQYLKIKQKNKNKMTSRTSNIPHIDPNSLNQQFIVSDCNKSEDIIKSESEDYENQTNNEKKFIDMFKQKINLIEQFLINKLHEINQEFSNQKNKLNNKRTSVKFDIASKNKNINAKDILKEQLKRENKERDELGFATSWKRSISNIYNQISWLHSYCTINNIAIHKIVKKFKKVLKLKDTLIDEETENYFKNLLFVDKLKDVVDKRKEVKECYADLFNEGNIIKSEKELYERMKGTRTKDKTQIAFHIGMIITCIISYLLLYTLPGNYFNLTLESDYKNNEILTYFPAFNFVFIIILIYIGVALNIHILKRFRLNYIYIFEIDPNARLGSNEIFRVFFY